MGFLDDWDLTYEEIDELLTDNPSLRSFVSGYAAELKCRNLYFANDHRATNVMKHDDHSRTLKGDISFEYRGYKFNVEVKSLQTNSIRAPRPRPIRAANDWVSPYPKGTTRVATFQCDASDRRVVEFNDGSRIETTCLLAGEFDLLAVNLHGFYGDWVFAFAKNGDLPRVAGARGASRNYTEYQRSQLLATSMPIFYPEPGDIYCDDPFILLDELISERRRGISAELEVSDVQLAD